MTGATAKNAAETKTADAVEKGIFSNMRVRREALVMAHEAAMGRTKNLMGSAMVFAEYADLDIMKTITSMINPVTIGVGLAAVAVVGLGAKLVELSAEAAESYHKLQLMGEQSGSTAQDILALQHAAIGTEIPTKSLADAFGKFTLRLGEHRAELAAVGITAHDPKDAFAQLMDVAAKTSDVTERNRILNVALGRSWEQLIPLLVQGGGAFRDALKEMQIPDSTKKRYEEINALQEENAKNWDVIKNHAAGAAAGVLESIDKVKLGFTELAKQRGLLSEIGNVAAKTAGGAIAGSMVAPGVGTVVGGLGGLGYAVYGLYGEGDEASKRLAAKPKAGGGTGIPGPSEDLLKQRSANEATLRKNDIKTALADEQKRYEDELALAKDYSTKLRAAGQKDQGDVEKEKQAHQMRMADIRKSFARKTPKGKHARSDNSEWEEVKKRVQEDQRAAEEIDKMRSEAQEAGLSKMGLGAQREASHVKLDKWVSEEQSKYLGHKDALLAIQEAYRAKSYAIDRDYDEKEKKIADDKQKKAEDIIKRNAEKIDAINTDSSKTVIKTEGTDDSKKYDPKKYNMERAEVDRSAALRKSQMSKEITDEKQKAAAIQAIEANTAAKKAQIDRQELNERKKNYEQYSSIVQSYAQGQLSSMLQGEFTLTKAKEAAKNTAVNLFAEELTKRAEKWVESLVFEKSESAVANAESIAQAQITGAMLAESYATAAAWASIMTMGVADAAGATGMATTLAAAKSASVGGFAGGGVQFGSAYTGERGPEISTPTVPRRITQTTNSTVNNSYGGGTIIINTGASVDRVAAVAVRATTRQARGMVRSSR